MIASNPVGINNSAESQRVLVGDFLRKDGQQSTVSPEDMIWDLADLAKILRGASLAGTDYEETMCGNFSSAAMQNGLNPFRVNPKVRELTGRALAESGDVGKQTFSILQSKMQKQLPQVK